VALMLLSGTRYESSKGTRTEVACPVTIGCPGTPTCIAVIVAEPTGLVVTGEVPKPPVVPPEVLLPEVVPPVVDELPPEVPVVPVAPVPVDPDEALLEPELLLAGAVTVNGPTCVEASWLPDPSATVNVIP